MTIYDLLQQLIYLYLWAVAFLSDSPKNFVYSGVTGLLVYCGISTTFRIIYHYCCPRFMAALRASQVDLLIELVSILSGYLCADYVHMWLDGWPS